MFIDDLQAEIELSIKSRPKNKFGLVNGQLSYGILSEDGKKRKGKKLAGSIRFIRCRLFMRAR